MTVADEVHEPPAPWIANDTTFGARLALIRQHMHWGNLKEAAVACGIPVESWRAWERDSVMPQGSRYFDVCAKIARRSGCDYGWLVDRRPSGSSQPSPAEMRRRLRALPGQRRVYQPALPILQPVKSVDLT